MTVVRKSRKIKKDKDPTFMTSNYRTEKCDFYNKGHCLKGDECTYRHDFVPASSRVILVLFRKFANFTYQGPVQKKNVPILMTKNTTHADFIIWIAAVSKALTVNFLMTPFRVTSRKNT